MRSVLLLALAVAACSAVEQPDESGLTHREKVELVEHYYGCARNSDADCLKATLHPDFRAVEGKAFIPRTAHSAQLMSALERSRLEARVLPHEGGEVWAVEIWTGPHGENHNRVQSFLFRDRLIRQKSDLQG